MVDCIENEECSEGTIDGGNERSDILSICTDDIDGTNGDIDGESKEL